MSIDRYVKIHILIIWKNVKMGKDPNREEFEVLFEMEPMCIFKNFISSYVLDKV
jgi:hypothetical protein